MYFENRAHAGQLLAQLLHEKYAGQECVAVGLSDGGVIVAEQVAEWLDCLYTMILVEEIDIPGESLSFGGISQQGDFTVNSTLSGGEAEAYMSEFHGYLDEQKREKFQKLNRSVGKGEIISKGMLRNKVVVLVADGINTGANLDAAISFLKPIQVQKIVIATPVASIPAVDKMHIAADDLCVLDVKENYINTDHYYDDNTLPSHEETIVKIQEKIKNSQNGT